MSLLNRNITKEDYIVHVSLSEDILSKCPVIQVLMKSPQHQAALVKAANDALEATEVPAGVPPQAIAQHKLDNLNAALTFLQHDLERHEHERKLAHKKVAERAVVSALAALGPRIQILAENPKLLDEAIELMRETQKKQ